MMMKEPKTLAARADRRHDTASDVALLCEVLADRKTDRFGYYKLAEWVANFLVRMRPPFVYAVCGGWGSGKSSFLRFLAEHLSLHATNPLLLYYNAWRASIHTDVLASFVAEIREQVGAASMLNDEDLQALRTSALGMLDEAVAAFSEVNAAARALAIVYRGARDRYDEDFRSALRAEAKIRDSFERLGRIFCEKQISPFIIIDELDRCAPSSAVRVIEATRMLFSGQDEVARKVSDLSGQGLGPNRRERDSFSSPFRYIISIDVDFVCRAFSSAYNIKMDEAQLYLDKFIQAKYHFPAKSWDQFIQSSVTTAEEEFPTGVTHDTWCYARFVEILDLDAPREVNRAIAYMCLWTIRDNATGENSIAVGVQSALRQSRFDAVLLKRYLSVFYFLFGAVVVKYPRLVGPLLRAGILMDWYRYIGPVARRDGGDLEGGGDGDPAGAIREKLALAESAGATSKDRGVRTTSAWFAERITKSFEIIRDRIERDLGREGGAVLSFSEDLKEIMEVGFEQRVTEMGEVEAGTSKAEPRVDFGETANQTPSSDG